MLKTMLRLLLASLLLVLYGCKVGPRISNLHPARTGQGIEVMLTTWGANPHRAEVLAVQEEGLLLNVHNGALNPIYRISYGAIVQASFAGLKRLNFGDGRRPSPAKQEELRLYSRYPQGVSEDLLLKLLAAYNQNELRSLR